jgi:hypothetical protein
MGDLFYSLAPSLAREPAPAGRLLALACVSLALVSCSPSAPPPSPARAEARSVGGQLAIVPGPGQLPLCLVFEATGGRARTLALAEDGQSVPCEAGKPIGGRTWPIPDRAASLRVLVVFSDRKLKADTVALQIDERLADGPEARLTSMDLRAPGQVALESLEIRPSELRP